MAIDTSLVWDQDVTVPSVNKLNDTIKDKVFQFILMAQRESIFLRVPTNGGYISFDDQEAKFNGGFSKVLPGGTFHNFGLAFDVLPLTKTKYTLDQRLSDGKRTLTDEKWQRVGQIGRLLGFEWGGDWLTNDDPHPKFDSAHFQLPRDIITTEELRGLRTTQGVDVVVLPDEIKEDFNSQD